ncbi:MAG: DnaJ domain-containing protein [Pseudomonadota bacterium]
MYIAFQKFKNQSNYRLRESCTINKKLTFRELFDLGPDPSVYIKYVGGNAFYFDEILEKTIVASGIVFDSDELEDLLWPWIRIDIRQAIETFKGRSSTKKYKKLDVAQKQKIEQMVHPFDKRRTHFLKFSNMDQGSLENMPAVLFKDLLDQSRDEIEQHFLQQELILKAHELKSYVYTVFDLQRFFQSFMAKKMPHAMDQDRVDDFFLKELCRLNKEIFNTSSPPHPYMIRYIIMFFDHIYADTTLLNDFSNAFMNQHRVFKPKPQNPVSIQNALALFNINQQKLTTMSKQGLTRIYRKLARQVHPDTGGSDEKFVELNNAFNLLMEKIKKA